MIYYEPSRIAFTAKSGETVDLACQLKETELLTLRGRIVDMAGKPLTGASAVAFAGNTYGWVDRVIITLNNSTMRAFYGRELGGCVVDIEGRFQLFVLRYEGDPVAAGTSLFDRHDQRKQSPETGDRCDRPAGQAGSGAQDSGRPGD